MDNQTMLACPFCPGGEAQIIETHGDKRAEAIFAVANHSQYMVSVKCKKCHARSAIHTKSSPCEDTCVAKQKAITAWNTRHNDKEG